MGKLWVGSDGTRMNKSEGVFNNNTILVGYRKNCLNKRLISEV